MLPASLSVAITLGLSSFFFLFQKFRFPNFGPASAPDVSGCHRSLEDDDVEDAGKVPGSSGVVDAKESDPFVPLAVANLLASGADIATPSIGSTIRRMKCGPRKISAGSRSE